MKKILIISTVLASMLLANKAQELFNSKCALCHKVEVKDKNSLIAPPINHVMKHVKITFKDKKEAITFIQKYAINPEPKKTICPSIDIFGVMPSQKGTVNKQELEKIANYLYENFPNGKQQEKRGFGKGNGQGDFTRIDSNSNGYITKDEFNAFRAKKEGIDISKFKYDYFFKKLDTNGDGKLSKDEFMEFRSMMRGQ